MSIFDLPVRGPPSRAGFYRLRVCFQSRRRGKERRSSSDFRFRNPSNSLWSIYGLERKCRVILPPPFFSGNSKNSGPSSNYRITGIGKIQPSHAENEITLIMRLPLSVQMDWIILQSPPVSKKIYSIPAPYSDLFQVMERGCTGPVRVNRMRKLPLQSRRQNFVEPCFWSGCCTSNWYGGISLKIENGSHALGTPLPGVWAGVDSRYPCLVVGTARSGCFAWTLTVGGQQGHFL